MEHYESDWWARQKYIDAVPRGVKFKRLAWLSVWTIFAKWMPYFIGRGWRVLLLSLFGMKRSKSVRPFCIRFAVYEL